jgi:hypothetical protein
VDFSDSERREAYHDTRVVDGKRRENYWCPTCGGRFKINLKGKKFLGKITGDAAPSEVETIAVGEDGMVNYRRLTRDTVSSTTVLGNMFRSYIIGSDILGCC